MAHLSHKVERQSLLGGLSTLWTITGYWPGPNWARFGQMETISLLMDAPTLGNRFLVMSYFDGETNRLTAE